MSRKRLKRIHNPEFRKPKLNNHLTAKTEGQKEYIRNIIENKVTFCSGPAGSGKSFCAIGIACQKLLNEEIDRITITRPIVGLGKKSSGFLPGTIDEKMAPYVQPVVEHLKYFLGDKEYYKLFREKKITVAPLEYMRGMTFLNTFVLLDESQNADYIELKMFISRFGEGSKMVINGDIEQCDLKYSNGDNDFARIMQYMDGKPEFGISHLTDVDIIRDSVVATFLSTLKEKEKETGYNGSH